MNWLRNFMMGRKGPDSFSLALIVAGMVITLISAVFRIAFLHFLAYVPLVYALFRILSKNIAKRQKEDEWFLRVSRKTTAWFKGENERWKNRKIYKYFRCPSCKQRLRAPKGKGKIQVTCSKCKNQFITKT